MFVTLLLTTAVACIYFIVRVWIETNDVYHPVMFFVPMLAFLYVLQPALLQSSHRAADFFTEPQLIKIQLINLIGVVALLSGACNTRQPSRRGQPLRLEMALCTRQRLRSASLLLGAVGALLWVRTIEHEGGFSMAFGRAYGGGWDDNGYIRELALYCPLAAALLRMYLCGATSANTVDLGAAFAFAVPILAQGLLGARRGPTFMACAMLLAAFDLGRGRRPQLSRGLIAGAAVGGLLLFLVTNRGNIYLGSDNPVSRNTQNFLEPGVHTEYVVGGGEIIHTSETHGAALGRYWFEEIAVRPIPRAIWPTKWQDYAEWSGTRLLDSWFDSHISETVGWSPSVGSVPGLVGEVFVEWGYWSAPVLWLMGNAYAASWHKARTRRGNWPLYYVVFVGLSIYVVMQGPRDAFFRFLLVIGMLRLVMGTGKRVWRRSRKRSPGRLGDPIISV